jgi:ribonuclease HI
MDKHLNNTICYTDGSKVEKNLGAKLCYMYNNITGQKILKFRNHHESLWCGIICYSTSFEVNIKRKSSKNQRYLDFSDNQAAIKEFKNLDLNLNNILLLQCQQSLQTLVNADFTSHIHWVSEHEDIEGNELTDKAAKLDAKQTSTSDSELCQETN